jgi:hypothetical protein
VVSIPFIQGSSLIAEIGYFQRLITGKLVEAWLHHGTKLNKPLCGDRSTFSWRQIHPNLNAVLKPNTLLR